VAPNSSSLVSNRETAELQSNECKLTSTKCFLGLQKTSFEDQVKDETPLKQYRLGLSYHAYGYIILGIIY